MNASRSTNRIGDAVLQLCAFASGGAALIYEIAWTRTLALSFGSTTLAVSAVVAAFLGGMGLGAWLHHRLLRRIRRALWLYASLEVGIAVSALGVTLALRGLPELVVALPEFAHVGWPLALTRLLLVFVLLAVPSILMGATFPALCTVLIESRESADRFLGRLYGVNTLGAAFGALAAGLVLLEQLGIARSVLVGAGINVAVAGLSLRAGRWLPPHARAPEPTPALPPVPTRLPIWLAMVVLVLSGFATLSYEILWFRALHYLFGGSTYAVTLMLAIFLFGLGFGSLAFHRVMRRWSLEAILATTQLGIGVLALVAIGVLALLLGNEGLEQHVSIFYESIYGMAWWRRLVLQAGVAIAIMLPPALLMGLSFPIASLVLLRRGGAVSAPVGRAALLSNLGSIVGSVSAALLTLPLLGTVGGTRAIAGVNLALGLAASAFAWPATRRAGVAVGALVVAGTLVVATPTHLGFEGSGFVGPRSEKIFERETDLATVQVWRDPKRPDALGMTIDGVIVGVSSPSHYPVYLKQILLAHLPFAIDADLHHALVVGLASASTVEALATHRGLDSITVVEISDAVAQGSRLFPQSRVLADPRVHLVIDDILHFLLRTTDRFDLIVSDGKQAMDYSGNSRQLSREFYELAQQRLTDDGIFVQWISTHMLPSDFEIIQRTFVTSFPNVEVFFDLPESVIMVGSRAPIAGRTGQDAASFAALGLNDALRPLGIDGPASLLSKWIASGDQIRAVVGAGPISTWDQSALEFSAYRSSPADWRRGMPDNLRLLLRAQAEHASQTGSVFVAPDSARAVATQMLREAIWSMQRSDPSRAQIYARRAIAASPDDPSVQKWAPSILERGKPRAR